MVDGYALLNARVGFRGRRLDVFVWSRNLLDKNYFELLTAAPGNTGLYRRASPATREPSA